ncbi:aminoacyltransferase [Macrococcus lamae]|uniref:Aminoacyltransferase FemA n=1 Tax=Macrococcus lamae TaxID=198484 RepID=A0A4R6BWX8_9STAP|nr:aminoacyltransferase [Macrococcus lamae]TDM12723.1 aminoacyltransferase [Macrococcus lamae]
MEFVRLRRDEYDVFVNEHFSQYTQSREHYDYRAATGGVHLLGVKNETGKMMAACLLTEAQILKIYKYCYTHRGPVMDYRDKELVKFFFQNLTNYLKKPNCVFVLVDPFVLSTLRNHNGEVLEEFDDSELFITMKRLGYNHQGFTTGYSAQSQVRFQSVLNVRNRSKEELLAAMDYTARRNIRMTDEMDVKVRNLAKDELGIFYELFHMAEDKHGFTFRDEAYFRSFQEMYKDNSMIKLAYINLDDYIENLTAGLQKYQDEVKKLNQNIAHHPNSKKQHNKLNDAEVNVTSTKKKIKEAGELKEQHGSELNLAAAVFVYNRHEVIYLSSGSNPEFNRFMGSYRIQWEMIQFAVDHNIPRYNFYGISGDFSEKAEDRGVILFKKGFNGIVEELVGDFIKPIKPIQYKVYQMLNKRRNH